MTTNLSKKQIEENKTIKGYMPLVNRIAYGYSVKYGNMPMDDLIQVGSIGLIKALKNSSKDGFKTYAVKFINGSIKQYIRDKHSMIRVSHRVLDNAKTDEELAKIDNIRNVSSLDLQIGDENSSTVADTLSAKDCNLDDKLDCLSVIKQIADSKLQKIFLLYYYENYSLSEIAKIFDTNKMNIQRNLKKTEDIIKSIID